jgi:alanyl-tRNA synthetase
MTTSSKQIRDSFRGFFEARGHRQLPSASLLPQNDPTLMFVNAGMVPFKDVFTGQDRRDYKRATTSQKCIRISGKHNDLENVGVTARHHTLFEMLGNFSFGDYFKEEAIVYAWEYLVGTLGLDKDRLIVTVFGGENKLPADTEAEALWRKVSGLPAERILRCGAADNFWSMGDTGPCGPCSELHYYFGKDKPDVSRFGAEPTEDGSGWVELWNLVFMQFERSAAGELASLPAPCIDTGAGLERLSCVLQNVVSNYDTDLLRPIVDLAARLSGKKYGGTLQPDDVSMRVIADHARTTAFLIAEGVFPDRDQREYVLRRVMRRAIRHGHRLGIDRPFLHECALLVTELMHGEYPELSERRELIAQIAQQEEERFRATLRRGLDRLSNYRFASSPKVLPGAVAFELYDTFGFPLDLQEVIGREQGFAVDQAGFETELEKARERSAGSKLVDEAVDAAYKKLANELPPVEFLGYAAETGASNVTALLRGGQPVKQLAAGDKGELVCARTPFYAESGGQMGDRGLIRKGDALFRVEDTVKPLDGLFVHRGVLERGALAVGDAIELEVDHALRAATRRNHSATHLLHLALRAVVGPHAMQKGSLVGPDRLRFDYSAAAPLEPEQIKRIEAMVTERVLQNVEVVTEVLPMDAAKAKGAIGIFEEKYGSVVRMLRIADSLELCGGTHVARTGDIGAFKVLSDGGIAAGVRRIEAATGMNALLHVQTLEDELGAAAALLKGSPLQTRDKLEKLLDRQREQTREIERLKRQLISGGSRDLRQDARKVGDVNVLGAVVDVGDPGAMRELADKLRDQLAPAVVVLGSTSPDGKALLICTVSSELTAKHKAGALIRDIAAVVGGKGGGRPDFAQAGGPDADKVEAAVQLVYSLVGA